jgi:hypothetical protein
MIKLEDKDSFVGYARLEILDDRSGVEDGWRRGCWIKCLNIQEMIRNIPRRELGGFPPFSEDVRVCIARTIADLVPLLSHDRILQTAS